MIPTATQMTGTTYPLGSASMQIDGEFALTPAQMQDVLVQQRVSCLLGGLVETRARRVLR